LLLKPKQKAWVDAATAAGFPAGSIVGYPDIDAICESMGGVTRPWWMINDKSHRAERGKFRIPSADPMAPALNSSAPGAVKHTPAAPFRPATAFDEVDLAPAGTPRDEFSSVPEVVTLAKASANITSAVPDKFSNYVPFGHFKDVCSIVASGMFYPIYITGLSGNGKTLMVEQVCAKLKRELFRVNVTKLTDEDDLLGGFRLHKGETVWFDGPVVEAMRRGAVLLLDEIDLGDEKIMCLQPILEGKPILLKKINEIVKPEAGFTVLATANTKGKGSEDGRFIGTNIMNEAMLERFPITFEQAYPSISVETKIVTKELASAGRPDPEFASKLVNWADIIRKTFYEGGVDEIIATRRLVHIAKAYGIFADRMKAITLALNRFDDETKLSFIDLYTKVDEKATENGEDADSDVSDYKDELGDDDSAKKKATKKADEELIPF